jgi:ATPase family associated with various cellular activities (AAA)
MILAGLCSIVMAQVGQLAKLFNAIAAGDLVSAQEVASDITASEERLGHHGAAQMLRGALRPNQIKASNGANGGTNGNGTTNGANHAVRGVMLHDALTLLRPEVALGDVRLRPNLRTSIDEVRLEWRHRVDLEAAMLPRRSRLLFHGPPGCGKSVTAAALGAELGLPVYVVRFDAVVGAYLGQTAVHLRELFRFAEANPCVLLFDEVDALGKHRGDPLDVGELHRIVITLMQELEHVHPAGYIVATSNLPTLLDPALWRRFDLVMEFPRPDQRERERFVVERAKAFATKVTPGLRAKARKAASFADAAMVVQAEARRNLLARLGRP